MTKLDKTLTKKYEACLARLERGYRVELMAVEDIKMIAQAPLVFGEDFEWSDIGTSHAEVTAFIDRYPNAADCAVKEQMNELLTEISACAENAKEGRLR